MVGAAGHLSHSLISEISTDLLWELSHLDILPQAEGFARTPGKYTSIFGQSKRMVPATRNMRNFGKTLYLDSVIHINERLSGTKLVLGADTECVYIPSISDKDSMVVAQGNVLDASTSGFALRNVQSARTKLMLIK